MGTTYACRPVGNQPEWMPLDNSLNNDIQLALSLHCAITAYLDDGDIRKFSFSTPSTIVSGIQRIHNNPASSNVPSSDRIVQDCNKALRAFGTVYEHNGSMVPGLANRNGHRNVAAGRNTAGWGGIRIKNLLIAEIRRWLHADAVSAENSRTTEIIVQLAEEYNNPSGEKVSDDE